MYHTVAQCAKAVREELKIAFPNIKFSVRSSSFSMGDDVNVSYQNNVPEAVVEKVIKKYQYGHFDGMTDMYENTNRRDDIPQTKYLFVKREISQDKKDQAKIDLAKKWGIENPDNEQEWHDKRGMWSDQAVWQELKDKIL